MQTTDRQQARGTPPTQRLILHVRWGPMGSRKMLLSPGEVLQVGRAQSTGLALPHDSELSEAHFELAWDGSECHLRDLKSTSGTLLGGERVATGLVHHGDWIRAGSTDFGVYLEGASPLPPEIASEPPQERESKVQTLRLLGEQECLFAVLDTARSDRILELLHQSSEEYRSLYEGPQGEALAEVAPYLVQLSRGSRLLEHLVLEGWGKFWGSYLTCPLSLLETRRHLRKFLMVEAEGQEGRLYFRFYDPRVLHHFLPTCTAGQRAEFFGHIGCFFYEVEGQLIRAPVKASG